MDVPTHFIAAIAGATIATALSEVDPLVRAIGGGASVGSALLCALEMNRDEPRYDRAAGRGAVGGALAGSALLVYDMLTA